MLARPGWNGNGLDTSPWWERAVFYRIDSPADARDIASRLDALRSLGVDALILPAPELPPAGSNGAMPNLDDLDNLLRQASSHNIRVLLTLHAANAKADLSGLARFWLSRGVAGLYVATPPGTTPEQTQALVETVRKSASGALGRRVVLTDS
jgi:glycosidase